jgi:hypothetical protein
MSVAMISRSPRAGQYRFASTRGRTTVDIVADSLHRRWVHVAGLHHFVVGCYHATVIRTQVSLTEDQMRALKREAGRRGVSIASIVRKAVDAELRNDDRDEKIRRAMEVMGKYTSAHNDISQNHDLYLDPDYEP